MASTTPNSTPPSYIDASAFIVEGRLPPYSRHAAADERIVQAQAQAPMRSAGPHTEYVFRSERLELKLGRRQWPVKVPCYGLNGTVKGTILVKNFRSIARITVTLEGACVTSIIERGMMVHKSSNPLLLHSHVLWTKQEKSPEELEELPFSFPIPTHIVGTNLLMPHSYATEYPGLNAEVTYYVRVDVFKKGIRRHERVQTMIMYLPHSTPPEALDSTLDIPQWETIRIFPKYSQQTTKSKRLKKDLEFKKHAEPVHLFIPSPTVYASAAPIPFHLSFAVDSPLLPNLARNLSAQLIKHTVIRVGGFISVRDGIIGICNDLRGEDEPTLTPPPSPTLDCPLSSSPQKVYSGTLQSFREGGESSWNIPGFLEIRYSLRVRIRAPALQLKTGDVFPEYFIDQPISMCTHNRIPNEEPICDPVIGLIPVTCSDGAQP